MIGPSNTPKVTDRKAQKRARNKAGYVHVSGYTDASSAPSIAEKLMSAEEVDRILSARDAEKEKDDE